MKVSSLIIIALYIGFLILAFYQLKDDEFFKDMFPVIAIGLIICVPLGYWRYKNRLQKTKSPITYLNKVSPQAQEREKIIREFAKFEKFIGTKGIKELENGGAIIEIKFQCFDKSTHTYRAELDTKRRIISMEIIK